jgi:hypothetical protein
MKAELAELEAGKAAASQRAAALEAQLQERGAAGAAAATARQPAEGAQRSAKAAAAALGEAAELRQQLKEAKEVRFHQLPDKRCAAVPACRS